MSLEKQLEELTKAVQELTEEFRNYLETEEEEVEEEPEEEEVEEEPEEEEVEEEPKKPARGRRGKKAAPSEAEVTAALAELKASKANAKAGNAAVRELLADFDAKKVADLDPDDYQDIIDAVNEELEEDD